jgi:hypothetical protein
MKSAKLLFALILSLYSSLNAALVSEQSARTVAQRFIVNQSGMHLTGSQINLHKEFQSQNQAWIYVFNYQQGNQQGFVLVAADDVARPVLGYSLTDTFNFILAPAHVMAWLEDYGKSISWAIKNEIQASEEIKSAWNQLLNNKDLIGKRRGSVSPMVSAKWNQAPYYNDMCPLDGTKRSVVGCVATAMAQVIRHWEYPTKGSGFHSYSHNTLGTISANFGNTTYSYSNMPDKITSKNNDVALLNFHCGVAVEMNYSAQSSGAYVISAASPITNCAEFALKKYFGYPSSVSGQLRVNYSTSAWKGMVNNDLDNGRPIIYAGFGTGGGHAFIFDGYDVNGKYHVNWGWGGGYNGYFEIDALDPPGLGTGGGSGGYNSGHQAIFGVEAPDNSQTNASISVYSNLSLSASKVSYAQPFSVTVSAANVSGKDFNGSLTIAVFDDSFNFVEFVGERSSVNIKDQYALNSIKFESSGSLSMLPGKYHLYLCFKNNGGEWKIADKYSTYSNYAALEIYYYSTIELYSDLKVSTGSVKNTQTTSVKFNVANTGTSTFRGSYAVSLYNMDGTFAQTIGTYTETNGLPSSSSYSSDLTVTSSPIDLKPGTYLLAAQYQATGSSSWILMGSYYKVNPIKVVVEEAPLKPDPYENNNEVNNAHAIGFVYSSDRAAWSSNITNIHVESDADFFKIPFEKDYEYTLDVKVSDINKSYNGNVYNLDARFSLSDDGVFWSSSFKNELNAPLTVNGNNKQSVWIRIVPAFAGLLGDYDLNVQITRKSTASIKSLKDILSLAPNPASHTLQINAPNSFIGVPFEIYGINGQLLNSGLINENKTVDIHELQTGIYFLKITDKAEFQSWKFIKE